MEAEFTHPTMKHVALFHFFAKRLAIYPNVCQIRGTSIV